MSAWVEHCKKYAKEHGCSYKQAMKDAKASYKPIEGGKINMKKLTKTVKNVSKGAKKVSKAIDKHGHYLDFIDEDLSKTVNDANNTYKGVSGGKVKVKNVLRKTKNTVNRTHKIAKELEPYVELATSGAGMQGSCPHCGSISGGSFKAIGGKGISPLALPGFDPAPPKSIKQRLIEN
jgi:hypothetical protein